MPGVPLPLAQLKARLAAPRLSRSRMLVNPDFTVISSTMRILLFLGQKCDITLEVQSKSDDQLYDILVLHLHGGKDVFITVTGQHQRSCFTTPLASLCKLPIPVSYITPSHLEQMKNGPVLYGIPRELFLLVDHLYRHGLRTKNLFERRALHSELIQVRDWLDSDGPDPPRKYQLQQILRKKITSTHLRKGRH